MVNYLLFNRLLLFGQGHGDDSRNRVEELVSHATRIPNIFGIDETPPVNSNHVSVRQDRTSGSMECSLDAWVNNNQIDFPPNRRLDNQPSENHNSTEYTTTSLHQDHNGGNQSGEAVSLPLPQLAADQSTNTNYVSNGTYAPIPGVVTSHGSHPSRVQVPISAIPRAQTSFPDPLEIEFDNAHREMQLIMHNHEGEVGA